MAWTCPRCDRSFGRVEQSHVCRPVVDVPTWLARQREEVQEIAERLIEGLDGLTGWHAEGKDVGLAFKRSSSFAELQPKRAWSDLFLMHTGTVASPRVHRSLKVSANRRANVVRLVSPDQVDDEVLDLLLDAYDSSVTDPGDRR
jgi:hypothetical protein